MKAYPKYKDSRVEWLGKIPEHWNIEKFKYLFSLSSEKNGKNPKGEMLSVSSYRGIVIKEYESQSQQRTSDELADYRVVKPNQLVVNTMWLNFAGLGVSKFQGYVSPAYRCYYICNNIYRWYVHYLLRSSSYVSGYTKYLQGIRPNSLQMKTEEFHGFPILIPPLEEQQAIANYLDRETQKIDLLIAKQEKLIALLEEKRQALIANIISDKKTKNFQLRKITQLNQRFFNRENKTLYQPIGMYNRARGFFLKDKLLGEELGDSEFQWIKKNDFVISGQFAWEGAISLAANEEAECIASHRYYSISGQHGLLENSYLFAFFCTPRGNFLLNENSIGAAGRNRPLNINSLMREEIPVPQFKQQLMLKEFVEKELYLKKFISKPIELLKEKRSALISAAVTGKIDVRESA
ncbi:restriction endonuclease subunit S [Leptospira dzoumogneensis]|uniref:Restriction endonuclease subunit S n=1 Tax=Leptospira dzoumogneensis TaxID=2484904 RepID=A0A4Z1ANX2_9LEPT|nr:restriction endonuclease subunit S [Leptospira dzoumogneensis]TGM95489.1 restriction endonuclease subunit S [Leptospira dzoumogneensis]